MKTTLISSVSDFSLRVEALFGGLSPQKPPSRGDRTEFWAPCVARRQTCRYLSDTDKRIFRLNTYKKSWQNGYAILTRFASTNTRNHRKTLREIFEKHQE